MKRGGEGSAAVSGDAVAAAILAAANAANSNTAQALVYVNHEYEATEESELSMAVGDVLEVLSEDTSGWWQGVNRRTGLEGWFPSTFVHWCDEDGNYLGETNPEEQGAGSVADDGSAVGNSFAASEVGADGVEYAYAVADFEATEENEMTLYVVAPAALCVHCSSCCVLTPRYARSSGDNYSTYEQAGTDRSWNTTEVGIGAELPRPVVRIGHHL